MAYVVILVPQNCVACGRRAYAEIFDGQDNRQGYYCRMYPNVLIGALNKTESNPEEYVNISDLDVSAA